MRKSFRLMSVVISSLTLFGVISVATVNASDESVIKEGKKIALNNKKGNCLACHLITGGGEQPGNIGPPLIVMKARFPDKEVHFVPFPSFLKGKSGRATRCKRCNGRLVAFPKWSKLRNWDISFLFSLKRVGQK